MLSTVQIPERFYRRLSRRVKETPYTLPELTVKLYTAWLDGGIELETEANRTALTPDYTDIFGVVKDDIDPAAPHDMFSIRRNIATARSKLGK